MSVAQTIKKMALEAVNASSPLQFIEGEVCSAPPNIQLRLKNNPKLIIPSEFIRISKHLTRHKRTINISTSDISGVMTDGDTSLIQNIQSLTLRNAEIEFIDELKEGDKVMIVAIQGGQSFFIIDKF